MKNTLILTPLSLEFKALEKGFELLSSQKTHEKAGNLSVLHFPDLGIRLSQGGHGKTQFAIQSQFLVQHYSLKQSEKIEALICAGCAGSLNAKLNPLDVIVGTKTIEHDFNLQFVKRPLPEFSGSAEFINQLMAFKNPDFKLHFGPIASGDEDILSSSRAEQLRNLTGAAAVAWEGAGGGRVAKFNQLPYLEVRGITDRADTSAIEDFSKSLEASLKNVVQVLLFLTQV